MQFNELLKLIDRLETSSISYVDYTHAGEQVILSKDAPRPVATGFSSNVIGYADEPTNLQVHRNDSTNQSTEVTNSVDSVEVVEEPEAEGELILSPMVGVVYLQANPDSEPFIQVGDTVKKDDVIVLVEAMKLMNEIQATKSGVITEVLIENEAVVEFNQPLVRIK